MTIEEKRQVIEVLLCTADTRQSAKWFYPSTWDVAEWIERNDVAASAARSWTLAARWNLHFDHVCLEAAYRLIESSPTLRREWFGAP